MAAVDPQTRGDHPAAQPSHGRSHSRVPPPASPLPASDQNQRIVRAPATRPDHDTPQADGYCSVGRAASRPGSSRRRVSNRPATERPGAASDRVTRRRPRHADGQTERPARPRAGQIPSCSSTPPAPRTPEAPRTPSSVTSTLQRGVISILQRGVISILRLQSEVAEDDLWKVTREGTAGLGRSDIRPLKDGQSAE